MNIIKKIFAGWNIFEYIFFGLIIILPVSFAVIFKSGIFELVSTLCGLFSAFFMAKGKIAAYPLSILYSLFYAHVSFNASLYGETIIALLILLPIAVYGLYNWLKNRRKEQGVPEVVIVKKLKIQEYVIAVLLQAPICTGCYFLLAHFNTEFPLVSSLSFSSAILAAYFLARRSSSGLYFYILNDIILITLWSFVIYGGKTEYLTIILTPILLIVSDIYGIYNWKRIEKSQSNIENESM